MSSVSSGRLRWRCRRGVRELDTLFTAYLDSQYPSATQTERLDFERLLEFEDPVLLDWLMGRGPNYPDPGIESIVARLRGD